MLRWKFLEVQTTVNVQMKSDVIVWVTLATVWFYLSPNQYNYKGVLVMWHHYKPFFDLACV